MRFTKATRRMDSTALMTISRLGAWCARRCSIASSGIIALALASLGAGASCSTTEVKPETFRLATTMSETNRVSFAITVSSPYDTFEADQTAMSSGHYPTYFLRVDGKWAVYDDAPLDGGAGPAQVEFSPGTVLGSALWMPEGGHTFEIVDQSGHSLAQSESVALVAGHANRLVFLARGGVYSYRFLSVGLDVPAGAQRVTLLNALPTGQSVEFITCTDFASTTAQNCTAVSDPIAYGEVSTRDVPLAAEEPRRAGSTASGIYFRTLPTATLPASEAETFSFDLTAQNPDPSAAAASPAAYFIAPRYTHPNGRIAGAL